MHVIISIHTGLYPQSLFGLLSLTDSSSHTGLNALPLATISPHGEHHFCAEFAIPNQRLGVTMAQTLVSPKSPSQKTLRLGPKSVLRQTHTSWPGDRFSPPPHRFFPPLLVVPHYFCRVGQLGSSNQSPIDCIDSRPIRINVCLCCFAPGIPQIC